MRLLGAVCRRSGGEVLLLKRNSLHNHDKWGLPGGNVDEGDDQALATAEREALEEMGSLPAYTVAGEIHTMCAGPLNSYVLSKLCNVRLTAARSIASSAMIGAHAYLVRLSRPYLPSAFWRHVPLMLK